MKPEDFARLVPESILDRSGSVFYSGRAAFSKPSRLYLLGLNPGGSPATQAMETVRSDLVDWEELPASWSAYCDESWQGRPAGTHGMQPRILHMLKGLGVDPREVPASNVVFVRSASEADLAAEKQELLSLCWPVHEAVIGALGIDTIICLGGTAGRWTREALGANRQISVFRETNSRGWESCAHVNEENQWLQ